jgi:hypothetical protein
MDTIEICRAEAHDCLRRADGSNEHDKPLWITLAQSWLQLAEDADRIRISNEIRSAQLEAAVEAALV